MEPLTWTSVRWTSDDRQLLDDLLRHRRERPDPDRCPERERDLGRWWPAGFDPDPDG